MKLDIVVSKDDRFACELLAIEGDINIVIERHIHRITARLE